MDFHMYNRYVQIDNPGSGDCAFYAFGIALIPILQTELNSSTSLRPVLNKFLALVPAERREACLTSIVNFDFSVPDKDLLTLFSELLRQLLYTLSVNELAGEYTDFAIQGGSVMFPVPRMNSSQIFSDVMGVFWHFYNNTAMNDSAN